MEIEFLLNGETVRLEGVSPTRTLLEWLREDHGLVGTKEGCNEGDCGACTVMVSSLDDNVVRHQSMNACILFLPQLHGKSLRTVEGAGTTDAMHPVQSAMVDLHGSQCGFCTPGFIMSMVTSHATDATDHNDALAGNLCRCTGYAPIIRAAEAAEGAPKPDWLAADEHALKALTVKSSDMVPTDLDLFADWYVNSPDATLVGGATDVGLWVNKALKDIAPVCFLSQIKGLKNVTQSENGLRIGAAVSVTDFRNLISDKHPDLAEMIRRYGSTQVRNAATIGGNIANGSPIGDSPPALIALGATLRLRKGSVSRDLLLEDFFITYGKQDRAPGEFVESIFIPTQPDRLKCFKLSKRFDQDISAVCGCFSLTVDDGIVTDARIAFGGMAGTPARASKVEAALVGHPWTETTVKAAMGKFGDDYTPMSDMRASADYRMIAAQNMLMRYYLEDTENAPRVVEVSP